MSDEKQLPKDWIVGAILTGTGRKWFVENPVTRSYVVSGQPSKQLAIDLALRRIAEGRAQ